MRKLVIPFLSLVVLISAAVALITYLTGGQQEHRVVISETTGEVLIRHRDGAEAVADRGREVGQRDEVQTAAGAGAVLTIDDGSRIQLGEQTHVLIAEVSAEGVHVELEDGALQATVRPVSGALRVGAADREVVTLDADFSVGRSEDYVTIDVQRGEVQVAGVVGIAALDAGRRARVDPEGRGQEGPIPSDLLLSVQWPRARTRRERVTLSGSTEPGATVRVEGGQDPVEVQAAADGSFDAVVPLREGRQEIRVQAVDVLGAEQEAGATIERDSTGPTFRGGVEKGP